MVIFNSLSCGAFFPVAFTGNGSNTHNSDDCNMDLIGMIWVGLGRDSIIYFPDSGRRNEKNKSVFTLVRRSRQ